MINTLSPPYPNSLRGAYASSSIPFALSSTHTTLSSLKLSIPLHKHTPPPTPLMASAATTKLPFTFNISSKPKPHFYFPQNLSISSIHKHPKLIFTLKSIDVSQEDKPTSDQPITEEPISIPSEFTSPDSESQPENRRPEEKFVVLNTGISECRSCGYLYNESAGDPSYPVPPGLPFEKLPEDWRCPTCGAAQSFFQSKSVEIAGFAENQQYGFGGNTLTSGQKALLIYGSLLFAFILFLSGYFIQ